MTKTKQKKLFINLFNEDQVINDNDVQKLLNTRIIFESDENYPKEALHMHAKNEAARKRD